MDAAAYWEHHECGSSREAVLTEGESTMPAAITVIGVTSGVSLARDGAGRASRRP